MYKIIRIFPFLGCLIFFLFSVSRLDLPVIGDETIYLMNHLSDISYMEFIPGFATADHFYGHPSGFPFLLKVLCDLSGDNLSFLRIIMILITTCSFLFIFNQIRNTFDELTAIITMLLFLSNQLLITQSVFIQPNMLFILLGLMGWFFYLNNKIKMAILTLCLSFWMRESGIAFTLALIFNELIRNPFRLDRKKILYLFIPIMILSVFYMIQKYKYGYYFGNPAFQQRGEFFSFNKEKINQFNMNWFMVKSFATSFPLIFLVSIVLSRFDKIKKITVLSKRIKLLVPLILLIIPMILYFVSAENSFRIQHTIVNISSILKIITGSFFFYIISDRQSVPFPDIIKLTLLTFGMFLIFYFFYQDTSPRDMNILIVLTLILFAFCLHGLFNDNKNKLIIGIIVLCFQLAWLKVPQVPHFTTHPKIHIKLTEILKSVIETLNNENAKIIYTTNNFYTLFSSKIYGWNKKSTFKSLREFSEADIVLVSNYYRGDLEFQKTFNLNKTQLKLIHQIGDRDYRFYIYRKSNDEK